MWLDTYAFQARTFYEHLGFSLFGQIDGPAGLSPLLHAETVDLVTGSPLCNLVVRAAAAEPSFRVSVAVLTPILRYRRKPSGSDPRAPTVFPQPNVL